MLNTSLKTLQGLNASSLAPCFYDTVQGLVHRIEVPNASLDGLDYVDVKGNDGNDVKGEADQMTVPAQPGNYWILTNEPVRHCLHAGKHVPQTIEDGLPNGLPNGLQHNGLTVVYNGVSGNLRIRMKEHLLRPDAKGGFGSQSGISLDLLLQGSVVGSHAKCLWSNTHSKKVPKIWNSNSVLSKSGGTSGTSGLSKGTFTRSATKDELLRALPLSLEERTYAAACTGDIYLKNGIHTGDAKHAAYIWRFVYAPVRDHAVRDYVEDQWRQLYGVPVLCSYLSGR